MDDRRETRAAGVSAPLPRATPDGPVAIAGIRLPRGPVAATRRPLHALDRTRSLG